jgi:HEAT repeat protein
VEKPTVDRQDIIYLGALAALGQLKDARVLDDLTTWLPQGDILMRRGNLESLLGPSMAGSIERLIVSSMGEEGDVRQAAVEVLGEFDSIRPVDLLLARLSDGSIFVRRGATRALGQLGKRDIRVVERLMVHLHDSDSGVRQNAAEALSHLGGSRAVLPLIALLQDRDGDVRQEAAKALGRLGDGRALEPLLSLLRGAKDRRPDGVEDVRRAALLAAAKIGLKSDPARIECAARAVFNNDKCDPAASKHTVSESERVRLAAAVVLLALPQPHASPDPEVEAFLEKYADRSQAISLRKELAEMLGDFPTARGQSLLLKWLDDTNLNVQESALKALGQARVQDVLPRLHEQLRSANFRIQKAAAEALAEIASVASLDELAAIASASKPKVEVSIPTRLASLQALYHIANKNSKDAKVRETVIKNMLAAVESEADQAILGMRAYKLLGDLQARQALDPLQERLQEQVKRLHQWRHAREASQDSTQPSRDMLEEAKLARHLAFELAYNIARIDPRASGLSLLGHDLAEIRQGAWKGVGSVGNAALITELHERLKNSDPSWFEKLWDNDKPFFRHAAYQAIDHILLRLEAEGVTPKAELERLKELASGASGTLCDHQGRPEEQGICKRVEWTIAQLEAHQPL